MEFDWSMIGAIATIIAILISSYFAWKARYTHKLQATLSFCDFQPPFGDPRFSDSTSPSEDFFSNTVYARTYVCLKLINNGERKICDINLISDFKALYYFEDKKLQLHYNKESAQLPDLLPNQSICLYILKSHLFKKEEITVAHKEGKAKIKYLLPRDHWLNHFSLNILPITLVLLALTLSLTSMFATS